MGILVQAEKLCFEEEEIVFESDNQKVYIKYCDIISCTSPQPQNANKFPNPRNWFWTPEKIPDLVIKYINRTKGTKWSVEIVNVFGKETEYRKVAAEINDRLSRDQDRPKKLAVFINPNGGRKNARKIYSNTVEPLFKMADISCDVMVSERPKHMIELISNYDLSNVDGIVICGGDGSLFEIVNFLLTDIQKKADIDYHQSSAEIKRTEVPIGIIPTGTGNGVSASLYGLHDSVTAALHIIKGHTRYINIQGVYSGGKLVGYSNVIQGYGSLADMMYNMEKESSLLRKIAIPINFFFFSKQRFFNATVQLITRKANQERCAPEQEEKNMSPSVTLSDRKGEEMVSISPTVAGNKEKENMSQSEEVVCKKGEEGMSPLQTVTGNKEDENVSAPQTVTELQGRYLTTLSCIWDAISSTGFMDMNSVLKESTQNGEFSLLLYSDMTSNIGLVWNLMQLRAKNPACMSKNFVSTYTVVGYKLTVHSDEEASDHDIENILNIDGELIKIQNRQFEVRLHPRKVRAFTSLF